MVTGQPAVPYIDLRSTDILRRFIIKEVKNCIYRQRNYSENSSVHGEFGTIEDWKENKKLIKAWLGANKSTIQNIVDTYA